MNNNLFEKSDYIFSHLVVVYIGYLKDMYEFNVKKYLYQYFMSVLI